MRSSGVDGVWCVGGLRDFSRRIWNYEAAKAPCCGGSKSGECGNSVAVSDKPAGSLFRFDTCALVSAIFRPVGMIPNLQSCGVTRLVQGPHFPSHIEQSRTINEALYPALRPTLGMTKSCPHEAHKGDPLTFQASDSPSRRVEFPKNAFELATVTSG
jgi:hypothetical protein